VAAGEADESDGAAVVLLGEDAWSVVAAAVVGDAEAVAGVRTWEAGMVCGALCFVGLAVGVAVVQACTGVVGGGFWVLAKEKWFAVGVGGAGW